MVVLIGRLVETPAQRQAEGDLTCVNFTLAVNRRIRRRDGSVIDDATFADCAMFGPRAEAFAVHHRKGDHALVRGRLQTDRWVTPSGEQRQKLRVVVEDWEFVDAQGRDRPPPS